MPLVGATPKACQRINISRTRHTGSLITKRVALIEDHFHMPMAKLLALSSVMQERLRTVKGDRYAKKKHGAMRDEPEQYVNEEKPSAREDEDGYLPEERARYD